MGVECRHCKRVRKTALVRGLCGTCYKDLRIRYLYPVQTQKGRCGGDYRLAQGAGQPLTPEEIVERHLEERVRDSLPLRDLPDQPTNALPGSEGKILVLQDRAGKGIELFHPGDATGVHELGELDVPLSCLKCGNRARSTRWIDGEPDLSIGGPVRNSEREDNCYDSPAWD